MILSPSTSFCQLIQVSPTENVHYTLYLSHVGTKWGHYEKEMPLQTSVGAFLKVPSGVIFLICLIRVKNYEKLTD